MTRANHYTNLILAATILLSALLLVKYESMASKAQRGEWIIVKKESVISCSAGAPVVEGQVLYRYAFKERDHKNDMADHDLPGEKNNGGCSHLSAGALCAWGGRRRINGMVTC